MNVVVRMDEYLARHPKVAVGDRVTYHGDAEWYRGRKATVVAICDCDHCCESALRRYVIRFRLGRLIAHVSERRLEVIR